MIKKTNKITPRDFFMNLLVFVTLYASVISFLALIFAYVNVIFPDNLNYYGNYFAEIITPSSVLIIIFPLFILTSWLLSRDFAHDSQKKELKFRKWLIYLTLFAAAITIIVDLISLVSSFYHGELTSRFIFKVLAVLLVALGVFWYYFLDLKKSTVLKPKFLIWLVSLIVLSALAGGFFIVGTPAEQRAKRFDERKINDLQNIQSQLLNYWMQKEELPEELATLTRDQLSGFTLPQDLETNLPYPYRKLTVFSFELCANFKTDSKDYPDFPSYRKGFIPAPVKMIPGEMSMMGNWAHEKGETCFERTIDPELYKKTKI